VALLCDILEKAKKIDPLHILQGQKQAKTLVKGIKVDI
jgi:hypothetical protein